MSAEHTQYFGLWIADLYRALLVAEPSLHQARAIAVDVGPDPAWPDTAHWSDLVPSDVVPIARMPAGLSHLWAGVVWSRVGRADVAWEHWERADGPELRGWVALERGRVLREFGLHELAEQHEFAAVDDAQRLGPRCVAAALQVSLVADAVGRNAVDLAGIRLTRAQGAVRHLLDDPAAARQRLRLAWVEAEVAWISGDEPDPTSLPTARPDGQIAWPADYAHGTVFHRSKGLLFAGMVTKSTELLDEAAIAAPGCLSWAVHLARADVAVSPQDRDTALADARASWSLIQPPAHVRERVYATATAQRLAAQAPGQTSLAD